MQYVQQRDDCYYQLGVCPLTNQISQDFVYGVKQPLKLYLLTTKMAYHETTDKFSQRYEYKYKVL